MTGGAALAGRYFADCVRPLLADALPGVTPAAARLGAGSDVLGFDDARSRDHDWGLRLDLFVGRDEANAVRFALDALPERFEGHPVRFVFTGERQARHHVEVEVLDDFVRHRLGFDPTRTPSAIDWLSLTGQAVLGVTAGPVFADPFGELEALRTALEWYPHELWSFVVACDWLRLDEELPFVGRAGEVGDESGSRLIAARLAHIALHLAFLLERRWPPYAKWLGTAARSLTCWPQLAPHLDAVLEAEAWPQRQAAVAAALDVLLQTQRRAGLPAPAAATAPFHDRPFLRVDSAVSGGLLHGVDGALRPGVGSAEQRTDVPLLLMDAAARRALVAGD